MPKTTTAPRTYHHILDFCSPLAAAGAAEPPVGGFGASGAGVGVAAGGAGASIVGVVVCPGV
jgi:hypothetical protein